MNYQEILEEISEEVQPYLSEGEVASYIPQLSKIPKNRFGMALQTIDRELFYVGDAKERFSIQSISKLLTLTMAMDIEGEKIWTRIGREPSGNSFNSLVQLEYEHGIPRNPFINAGALVVTDIILSKFQNAKESVLSFIDSLLLGEKIEFDLDVAHSEKSHGHRNFALAHFIKSFNNLDNEPSDVADAYFHHCSTSMNCIQLTSACLFLANRGVSPLTGKTISTPNNAKHLNSLMLTSGTYDTAGDFAYRVGLPSKSGVGGGIVAVMPEKFCVCVWSPGLNKSGNSLAGTKALELFAVKTGISIF